MYKTISTFSGSAIQRFGLQRSSFKVSYSFTSGYSVFAGKCLKPVRNYMDVIGNTYKCVKKKYQNKHLQQMSYFSLLCNLHLSISPNRPVQLVPCFSCSASHILMMTYKCDVIKQNQSELRNIDLKMEPNKAENVFCFLYFGIFKCSYLWNRLTNFNGVFCKM